MKNIKDSWATFGKTIFLLEISKLQNYENSKQLAPFFDSLQTNNEKFKRAFLNFNLKNMTSFLKF